MIQSSRGSQTDRSSALRSGSQLTNRTAAGMSTSAVKRGAAHRWFSTVAPYQTFAGGFAWAMPFGTKNPDVSWAMLRSLMSEEALGAYAEVQAGAARAANAAYLPVFTTVVEVDKAFRQKYATKVPAVDAAWDFTIKLMDIAKVRPVSPAAAEAWDALSECWNTVLARKEAK